jgi:hypothetical protein
MHFRKAIPDLLFVLFLVIASFFYGYFKVIDQPPKGIHVWRQADGASMAYNYYVDGNPLLEPQMSNQQGNLGKAAGEFPLMYYLVAVGYHIFGYDYLVYRLIWMLTTYIGLFCLYKLSSKILNNSYYGAYVAAFLFTSPVYVVYGISFIPDSIALSISLIGLYFIYQYSQQKSILNLGLSILFVALAALLKITNIIPTLAVLGTILVLDLFSYIRKEKHYLLHVKGIVGFLVLFLIIFSWYKYADWYNQVNETKYFFLRTAPIWNASAELIAEVKQAIMVWKNTYLFQSGRHFIIVLMALVLIPAFYKRLSLFYIVFYVIALAGFLSFFLLFFSQFMYHDYYAIALMIIIPLTILMFIKKYSWLIEKSRVATILFSGTFLVFLLLSVIHTSRNVNSRFNPDTKWLDNLHELKGHLEEYGIAENDFIVAPDDASPNVVLDALKRKGWSANNFAFQKEVLEAKILQGAKYMVITDTNFYQNPLIDPYRNNLVVDYKGIRIYGLEPK